MPREFGPWQTLWKRHAAWSADGTWARILAELQARADELGELDWLVGVDSSIVRAHQHAAGARRRGARLNHKSRPRSRPEQALGRSRGGWSTKIHLAVEGGGRPLALHLNGGHTSDTTQLERVLAKVSVPRAGPGRPRSRPARVIADKGYSSRANRRLLRRRGIGAVIPERDDQLANRRRRGRRGGRPYGFDAEAYRDRNLVERGFNPFKQWRGLATRYDKTATNYLGGLQLASAIMWADDLAHSGDRP